MQVLRKSLMDQASKSMLNILSNKELSNKNQKNWNQNVATKTQILDDIIMPKKIRTIQTPLKNNLLIRAIVGHARSGHCLFKNSAKINTTLDDIAFSNKLIFSEEFFSQSREVIDQIGFLAQKSVSKKPYLATKLGKPLLKINMFNEFIPIALQKGIFWGGYFDNYDQIRKKTEELYGLKIGGGTSKLINKKILKKLNISLLELNSGDYDYEILNQLTFEERMKVFEDIGLIKEENKIDFNGVEKWSDITSQCENYLDLKGKFFQEYIRESKGSGVSDDIACLNASFINFNPENTKNLGLHIKSLINGASLADLVDTLTKGTQLYAPSGFDEILAKYTNHIWREKITHDKKYRAWCNITDSKLEKILEDPEFALIPRDEIIDLVALSVNPLKSLFDPLSTSKRNANIHSSARYFLKEEIDEERGIDSYILEQEMVQNFKNINKILKKKNLKEIDIKSILSTDNVISGLEVGYSRTPFKKIFRYLEESIYPIVSLPPEQRREQIHKLYNN